MKELSTPAVALDIPGRIEGATPDSCADALVTELDREGVDSVILVLHSLAGVLAPGLAARLESRLKHIVYVAAVIPQIIEGSKRRAVAARGNDRASRWAACKGDGHRASGYAFFPGGSGEDTRGRNSVGPTERSAGWL